MCLLAEFSRLPRNEKIPSPTQLPNLMRANLLDIINQRDHAAPRGTIWANFGSSRPGLPIRL
jgi:hypothetical protein